MIVIKDLYKQFGKVTVLNGINLVFEDKGIHTILGPNGSGKTTLIKSILGMVIPNHGSIEFNGKQILGEWKYRNDISYLPQIAHFPQNLKVKELFEMINDLRPGSKNESELISTFQLEPYLDKKLGNLSRWSSNKFCRCTGYFQRRNYLLFRCKHQIWPGRRSIRPVGIKTIW